MSNDTGVFHGERLQFSNRINRWLEGRTELVGSNYSPKKVKTLIPNPPQLIIASDASLKGWNDYCQEQKRECVWTLLKKKEHINVLEMTAAKYAILTFT